MAVPNDRQSRWSAQASISLKLQSLGFSLSTSECFYSSNWSSCAISSLRIFSSPTRRRRSPGRGGRGWHFRGTWRNRPDRAPRPASLGVGEVGREVVGLLRRCRRQAVTACLLGGDRHLHDLDLAAVVARERTDVLGDVVAHRRPRGIVIADPQDNDRTVPTRPTLAKMFVAGAVEFRRRTARRCHRARRRRKAARRCRRLCT